MPLPLRRTPDSERPRGQSFPVPRRLLVTYLASLGNIRCFPGGSAGIPGADREKKGTGLTGRGMPGVQRERKNTVLPWVVPGEDFAEKCLFHALAPHLLSGYNSLWWFVAVVLTPWSGCKFLPLDFKVSSD